MAKKPFQMTKQELGDALELRVAKALNGRQQIGSGRVKVPTLRSDVLAVPYLIECKATKENHITIQTDVWVDLLGKVKETQYLPSYAVGVVDQWGEYYDFVGINYKQIPAKLIKQICPNGLMATLKVKKTKKVPIFIEAHKTNRFIEVQFEGHETLWFMPLPRLRPYYKDLIKEL